MRVATFLDAARRVTPPWVRRRMPWPLKRWLLVRYWGMTPFDFDARRFDETATADDIYYCYRLLLGRLPDRDGWKTYEGVVRGGVSVHTLAADFLASPEFRRRGVLRDDGAAAPVLAELGTVAMYVIPDDFVGLSILREKTYEPHVVAALRPHLAPGRVLVDLGAHVGYFSLIGAGLVGPSGRVVSFEPDPVPCALLMRNARLNGFSNIEVYPLAVAEKRGPSYLEGRGSHAALTDPLEWTGAGHGALVMAVTLDEMLHDASRVDVIKMDIEGAEFRAVQGGRRLIARHRPVLISELSGAALQSVSRVAPEEYLRTLVDMGYEVSIIQAAGGLLACGTDTARVLRALEDHPATHLDLLAAPR